MRAPREKTKDDRPLIKTGTKGIYKRGNRYVVRYRAGGKSRKAFARTLAEARELQGKYRHDRRSGEASRERFEDYATRWIESYTGRTSRGLRDSTRTDYRRAIEQHAIPHFGRMRLNEIRPRDVKDYAQVVSAKGLSPNSVRLAIAPVKALLATAVEDDDLPANPAAGLRGLIPHPAREEESERAKALTEKEAARLVAKVELEWRLLVTFLIESGLRISEALALRWSDLDLGRRRVKVRRRLYRGGIDEPKTKHGRRDVPLSEALARDLWQARKARKATDGDPVFADAEGAVLDRSVVFRAVRAGAKRAGVPWAGLHTLRHTCASILFRHGLNPKQVQAWLGHHAASFTLDTYIHLLDDDLPDPCFFDEVLGGHTGVTRAPETGRDRATADQAESAG
jgi:integrase